MKRRMINGYEVTAHPPQAALDLPHITIAKLGSREVGFMTPDEARKFADAIVKAAAQAEVEA